MKPDVIQVELLLHKHNIDLKLYKAQLTHKKQKLNHKKKKEAKIAWLFIELTYLNEILLGVFQGYTK